MKEKDFIVAIELGSSAIRGIVGRKQPDGSVQVERIAQVCATDCVRRGVVYNIDKTTNAIRRIRETLEHDLQLVIKRAYVGIQGQSMRTVKNFVKQTFDTERQVTDEDVDDLLYRNQSTNYGDLEILEVIPQEYKLDHDEIDEPKGIQSHSIEGRFNNIVSRTKLRENITRCFDEAGLQIAGQLIVAPLALAERVTTDIERRSGCAIVDIGAQTTTVQVYKGGKLRYMATIPLGGASLTHDIATYRDIDEHDAETLKISYGVAIINTAKEETTAEVPITGERIYPLAQLERITDARTEEILRNVDECIHRSEMENCLTSGIYLTGGGARLTDMAQAYKTLFPKFTKVHITRALITSDEISRLGYGLQGGNFDMLIALLHQGDEICTTEIPPVQAEPTPTQGDLFEETVDDKKPNVDDEKKKNNDDDDDPDPIPAKPGLFARMKSTFKKWSNAATEALEEG